MIKKVVMVLLLIGAGFFALYAILDPAPGNARPDGKPPKPPDRGPGGDIKMPTGTDGDVVVVPGGALTIPRLRRLTLPDGRLIDIPVYKLHAENSYAERADNKLVLEDVTVNFYSLDESNPLHPRPVVNGRMTADKVRVEPSQDQDGRLKIAENKQMEFWNLVYKTTGGSVMRNSVIRLPYAVGLNTDDMIHLWTKDERVEIESIGPEGFSVTGLGLDAWIPSSRSDSGNVQISERGTRRITILRDPVLVKQATTVRSRGRLHIKEDSQSGTALVTMVDDVRVTTGRRATGAKSLVARGDSLAGVLARTEVNGRETTVWNRFELRGTPAHLTNNEQIDLRCGKLTVYPDSEGNPYWITADGTGEFAPVMQQTVEGETRTFRGKGKVHFVHMRKQHGFFLQSYGITAACLPPEFDQVIIFEDEATVSSPKNNLDLYASRGVTVMRSERPELRDFGVLMGRGDVRVTSDMVRTSGNRGFTVHQRPDFESGGAGTVADIRLGPEQTDTGHRYDVQRLARQGEKGRSFRLVGSGTCTLRMRNDTVEEVHLSSLAEDIDFSMTGTDNRLWQVGRLDAWFKADGLPKSFVARGRSCEMSFANKDGVLHGRASEVQHPGPDTYRLVGRGVGSIAEVRHEEFGLLRGRDILVHRLSDQDLRLRATNKAELHARDARKKGELIRVGLRADEIRVEPFLMPPAILALHTPWLPPHLAMGFRDRYLFAKGNVDVDYEITRHDRVATGKGTGDRLILRADRDGRVFAAGQLFGAPATFSSVDERERHTTAVSHHIRFFHHEAGQFVSLERVDGAKPELTLVGKSLAGQRPTDEPLRLKMICGGRIDLEPRRILCHAPVSVRSLDLSGKPNPAGYALDAQGLTMGRAKSGEVNSIRATTDVHFRWREARGTSDELSVDLERSRFSARGTPARIWLADDLLTVTHLDYDYRTKMVESWNGQAKRALTHK